MQLTSQQANRVRRIVNEWHADKVTISKSDDLPDDEVYVDFHVPTGSIEATLSNYGELTAYDSDGCRIPHYSD